MSTPDWDSGLSDLVRAQKENDPSSRIRPDDQAYLRGLLAMLHAGGPGGIWVRTPDGNVQYLFIGDIKDALDAMVEVLQHEIHKRTIEE